ncbi:caspase family protein [Pyxidicoccus caerfyrddinensis]|uniref:caspase family protein n=1 Tax=Pyxidicoccus caerfyrddinensis TaxID=2709663 RepID=UPI0013DC25B7|nr:caspase family protein [Pyxidicoccus caerfyrddinensis]
MNVPSNDWGPGEEQRVAVVVGSDEGLPGETPLEYAEADARRFHQLLLHAGKVAPEHAFLVTEGGADGVRLALARARELLARARPKRPGALVFYVSAHADAEALHLAGTRLPLAELKQLLADMPATLRLALVDACRTPVITRAKGGTPSAAEVAVRLEAPSEVEGTVLLMAASDGEPAQEWASLRGALFTHHVLGGLRGLADVNEDGAVTLAELYSHAWRHTLASSTQSGAGAQHPSFDIHLSGWGEWVLARPEGLGASLVLGEDVEGSLWVADHEQELVAEIRKARGTSTRLAVRPGRYRVVRPDGMFAEAADVLLGWRAERVLTRSDFLRVPGQRARLRGGAPLALRPWEASVGYAVSSGSLQGLGAAHFGEVGLRHRWSRTVVRARLGLTRAGMERESFSLSQTELQVALGGGLSFPAGPVELTAGAEARATWVWQSLRRVDEEQAGRIFGVGEAGRWGIIPGLGPFVAATYPLAERLQLGLEGAAGVTRAPRYDGKAELQPSVQLRAAVHWAL